MDYTGEWQVVAQGLRQVLSEPQVRTLLLVGFVGSVGFGWLLGRKLGWRPVATILTLLWLTVVLALTLPISTGGTFDSEAVRDGAGFLVELPGRDNLAFWEYTVGTAYGIANIALFVPFGLFLALASRRLLFPIVAGIALTVGVETIQAMFGRVAESDDVINNSLGTLIGVGLAAVIAGLLRLASYESGRRRHPDPA